ncbi:MAG: UDP-3-O-(3-hydroxymyristoyl)glucosamine N-acyltransferase [Candidatus Amulumruptor caecigallinarius]|nr:UDP-3-O-(3-hydroxymyristoyl)glucosamine N-acyltransferase [Candidatus Amulumruptor caecigallinarius]
MKITPLLIASMCNGAVEGDGNVEITGFAKIEEAKSGDISFIANPKYAHFLESTHASALLVSEDLPASGRADGPVLIRVKDPYVALASLMTAFEQAKPEKIGIEQPCYISEDVKVPEDCYIGAFAYIGKGAKLGKGVKIYPQAFIGDGVEVGDNTIIYAGAKIYAGCKIGERCVLHAGCVIGADGFGFAPKPDGSYEKIPQIGIVVIENDVEIGANTTIDRATFGCTRVGEGTKLDNLIQIGHNVELGKANVFAAQTGVAGSTKIGSYNRVGGQCGFSGHIVIGDHNEFGAQSGIPNNVGSKKRMVGYPAVDFMKFAKTQVYLSRLPLLFKK